MTLANVGLSVSDVVLGGSDAEADPKLAEYFVNTPYVQTALAGRRSLFLGRKGSGKSALFTQLPRLSREQEGRKHLVDVSLTPDQYAWASLRAYTEQGLLAEQAHTNAWKLTLVVEIASRVVQKKRRWKPEQRAAIQRLSKFLGDNFRSSKPSLATTASALTRGLTELNLTAFGFGIGFAKSLAKTSPLAPAVLDAVLAELRVVIADQPVLVLLDRLDDSWDGSPETQTLLVGLLKAAKEINDHFASFGPNGLRIITFLRSDIYDALRFDDKDKHRATEEHISWTPAQLKEMLQRRLPERVAVDALFEPGDMRGSISPFQYIVRRTFFRPREVLQFVDECLSQTDPGATAITKDAIRLAEERYSRWKVSDLKQEYQKILPDFEALLEALRQERHRYDSLRDLELLLKQKTPDLVTRYGTRPLLEILFNTSVIGIRVADAGSTRFKAEDSELVLPNAGAVYVHQSLYKGLNVREVRRAIEAVHTARDKTQDRVTVELYEKMLLVQPIRTRSR